MYDGEPFREEINRLKLRHAPLLGMILSIVLFAVAMAYYPGGTSFSANTIGYNWSQNFLSSLFQPRAYNGSPNPARWFAIPAMFLLSLSYGFIFRGVSRKSRSKVPKKVIEIGGIGSAVYTFLVVTPMHNLMITISLLFFITAVLATLHLLYTQRQTVLLAAGFVCVAVMLISCVMYYGNVFFSALPVAQKLTFVLFAAWILALHYKMLDAV
jgi:hypothetical protein